MRLASRRAVPLLLASFACLASPLRSQVVTPIPGKQPPPVTRQMGELTGDFVQSRSLWLSGIHARLKAMLAREGLETRQPITREAVESRRLREITARDTSGLVVTINVVRDPDESGRQLAATCYVSVSGELQGRKIVRGSPEWPRLVHMIDFLTRANPADPDP